MSRLALTKFQLFRHRLLCLVWRIRLRWVNLLCGVLHGDANNAVIFCRIEYFFLFFFNPPADGEK